MASRSHWYSISHSSNERARASRATQQHIAATFPLCVNDSVKPCRPSWTVNPRVICWVSHLRHFVTRPKVPILAHAVWRVFSTSPPHVGAPLSGLRSSKLEKIAPEYRGEVYSNILKGREKPANHLGEIAISLLRFFNEEHGIK